MKKVLIATLKIIIPIGIGVYLTWFFLSSMSTEDLEKLKLAFFEADYTYIFYATIVMLSSHMSRAYRWKYMLEPLGHKPSFWKMYHSVMIGYLLNLTIPRSGEVARAGYYSKFQSSAPFNKVFGTIVVERVLDVIMLGIVFVVTLFLQQDLDAFNEIKASGKSGDEGIAIWVYYTIPAVVIVIVAVVLMSKKIKEKVLNLLQGVLEGVKTIFKLKQRAAYIAHTLYIWVCYILMIWICGFALPESANLSIPAVFAAFTVGAVAMSTTPGGIGLYPLMVSAVLGTLYHITNAEAYSMLAWASLTLFTILAGLVSLFALPFISKKEA